MSKYGQMDGCSACIKYVLGFINLFLFIGGAAILGLGIWSVVNGSSFSSILNVDSYDVVSYLLLAAGIFVSLVTFLGCCGAFKESKCLLYSYFCFVFILFVLMLAGGIAFYVFGGKLTDLVSDGLKDSLDDYYSNNKDIRDTWDETQKTLKCCGVEGPADYNNITGYEGTLPNSCCKHEHPNCKISSGEVFKEGCLDKVEDALKGGSQALAGVAIGVALTLFVAMIMSCVVIRAV